MDITLTIDLTGIAIDYYRKIVVLRQLWQDFLASSI